MKADTETGAAQSVRAKSKRGGTSGIGRAAMKGRVEETGETQRESETESRRGDSARRTANGTGQRRASKDSELDRIELSSRVTDSSEDDEQVDVFRTAKSNNGKRPASAEASFDSPAKTKRKLVHDEVSINARWPFPIPTVLC